MDPITHALAGCAIADAGFRRRLGPRSVAAGALLAASPDIDLFFRWFPGLRTRFDGLADVWFTHRALTHAFSVQLAMAVPLGLLAYLCGRRAGGRWSWMLLALLALFSHTLLDLANSWGTRAFLPWSEAWAAWDALPIIDFWVTGALLLSCLAGRWLWRRADHASGVDWKRPPDNSALGGDGPAPRRARAGIAASGLAFAALAFIAWHIWLEIGSTRSIRAAVAAEWRADGFDAATIRAMPAFPAGRFRWVVGRDLAGGARAAMAGDGQGRVLPLGECSYPAVRDPRAEQALSSDRGQAIVRRTGGALGVSITEDPNGQLATVWLHDLRIFRFDANASGPPVRAWRFDFDSRGELAREDFFQNRSFRLADAWKAYNTLRGGRGE